MNFGRSRPHEVVRNLPEKFGFSETSFLPKISGRRVTLLRGWNREEEVGGARACWSEGR